MSYHLNPIPMFAETSDEEGYYVGRSVRYGSAIEWMSVSDSDPVDDVRRWNSIKSARSVAAGYVKYGERVDAIVEVTPTGRVMHYDGFEQKDPLDQLYEDLVGRPGAVPNPAYTDFGSW